MLAFATKEMRLWNVSCFWASATATISGAVVWKDLGAIENPEQPELLATLVWGVAEVALSRAN